MPLDQRPVDKTSNELTTGTRSMLHKLMEDTCTLYRTWKRNKSSICTTRRSRGAESMTKSRFYKLLVKNQISSAKTFANGVELGGIVQGRRMNY